MAWFAIPINGITLKQTLKTPIHYGPTIRKTEEPNIVWEISIEYIASNGAKEQASIICSNFKLNKL